MKLISFILTVFTIFTSSLAQAGGTTSTAEYKFPALIDNDVLPGTPTELWARAYWPTDLSQPRPVVFLLHGNHSTCREAGSEDYDCTYTLEGSCPTGMTVIKNHEGLDYLAEHLASLGYIAVTINANRGITCGAGNDLDWGLNLARGRLVLRHIELWNKWATAGGAPSSLGVSPDAFVGHVDLKHVGLIGHSRGGEGMRAAAALYRDAGSVWTARIPGLEIRGIFEIGSVDGQANRVLDADDMAWNQLLPMCDGDVSDLEGRLPFERMLKKSSETRKSPKSLTMVWGANHNFFNTEWRTNESRSCFNHSSIHGAGPTSSAQQTIAKELAGSFILANVGAARDVKQSDVFDPARALPSVLTQITRIDRDQVFTFDRVFDAVVDDFDQASGISSNHQANAANGISVKNNASTQPAHADVSWTASGPDHFLQLNWEDQNHGRDVSTFTSLDLRINRPLDQATTPAADFSIVLVSSTGALSKSVAVSSYAQLVGPANLVDLYQTVRIPLGDFSLASGFLVRGVKLIFDRTPSGSLAFANVRFASKNLPVFVATANKPLLSQPIVPIKYKGKPLGGMSSAGDDFFSSPPPFEFPSRPAQLKKAPRLKPIGGFDPYASVTINSARLAHVVQVASSKYVSDQPAVDLSVSAIHSYFPAESQLPILVMGGNGFPVSRYQGSRLGTLIFSVPAADFAQLPERGEMWVQYGKTNAEKFWKLPDYVKSDLPR